MLAVCSLFFISNSYYQHVLKPQNDEKYTTIALDIAEFIQERSELDLNSYLELVANTGYQMKLVDTSGKSVYYGEPFREAHVASSDLEQVLAGEVYHGIAEFPNETFVTGLFANEIKNSIGVPVKHGGNDYALFLRPDLKLHFNELHFLFAWLLVLTVIFSLIFEITLAKYLIHPLSKLNEATKLIKEGKFSFPFHFKRKDEIGELANSFQEMSQQLAQLETMRTEFISNISHDIQSPLANIKGYTDLIENPTTSSDQKQEYLSVIRQEAERLSSLTDQLLTLSSITQMDELAKTEPFSLSQQIKSLIRKYQWKLSEKDISLHYVLPETTVEGDPSLLLSVWDNLLNNAIKYNERGGTIFISLKELKGQLEVVFKDNGIGLTPKQQEKAFERFYRGDPARTKEIEGSGLGLSIAIRIVELHHGEMRIESKEGEGTAFITILPTR